MPSLYRSLLVGLGSWGRQVVEEAWGTLQQQAQAIGLPAMPYVNVLVVDVENTQQNNLVLPPDSYVLLPTYGMQAFLKTIAREIGDLPEGANLSGYGTGRQNDPKNTPLGMRFLLHRHVGQVAGAMDLHLNRLVNDLEWTWASDSAYRPVLDNTVTLYIAAALDESRGSGMLLEFLRLLPEVKFFRENPDRRYYSVGVFSAFRALFQREQLRSESAMAYATLMELNSFLGEQLQQRERSHFDFRQLSLNQHIYLLEAVDENGSVISEEEGRHLAAQFLVNSVANPVPASVIGDGILGWKEKGQLPITGPQLPVYSSFTQVEVVFPVAAVKEFLALQVGRHLVADFQKMEPSEEEIAALPLEEEIRRLAPEEILGNEMLSLNQNSEIFLSSEEQKRGVLFSEEVGELIKRSRIGRFLQWIQEEIRQKEHFWGEYCSKVKHRVAKQVIPDFDLQLQHRLRSLLQRPTGIFLSERYLHTLLKRLEKWQKQAEDVKQHLESRPKVEKPKWSVGTGKEVGRWLLLVLLSLIIFGTVTYSTYRSIQENSIWLTLLARVNAGLSKIIAGATTLAGFFTPIGKYVVLSLVLLTLAPFINRLASQIEAIVRQDNSVKIVPGWGRFMVFVFWPAGVMEFFHWLVSRAMQDQLLRLVTFELNMMYRIVYASGAVTALLLLIWYWYDIRKVQENALKRYRFEQEQFVRRYLLFRAEQTVNLYERLRERIGERLQQLESYRVKLQELDAVLDKQQQKILDDLRRSEHRFRRLLAADRTALEARFQATLEPHPDINPRTFIDSLEMPLVDWLEGSEDENLASLRAFGKKVVEVTWRETSLVNLLGQGGDATQVRHSLLPQLDFVREYRPQWSYYRQRGEVQIFVGVGSEDDSAMREAIKGLGRVTFEATPVVYEIGDPFKLVIGLFRHGHSLDELEELYSYREAYRSVPAWEVHTLGGNLVDPLPLVSATAPVADLSSEAEAEMTSIQPLSVDQACQLLGLAPDEEVWDEQVLQRHYEAQMHRLEEAKDGLLDKFHRYRHFAQLERGLVPPGEDWFSLLDLPRKRDLQPREVNAHFERAKRRLEEALKVLLGQSVSRS